MNPIRNCFSAVGAFSLVLLTASAMPVAAGSDDDLAALEDANRRWKGARCRSRMEITVKKSKNSDGWSKSEWLWWGEPRSNERVRVMLTESAAIRNRYVGGSIPIGSEFIAVGWGSDKRKGGGDVYLELEHVELGARARVYYYDDWVGRVSAGRLPEFERWARLEMFSIESTPDEQLVEVAAPVAAETRTEPSREAAAAPVAPTQPEVIGLRVLGVTTEPLAVKLGESMEMVVTYEVSGVPEGLLLAVSEQRTILRNGQELTKLEAMVQRATGLHRSTQSLVVPTSLEPGVFELRATMKGAGAESAGKTLFEVREP
ncbi:MAG: hypothetical protein GY906_09620 [bacterium]|nr:hypothetical protein [bacterium]